MIKGEIYLPGDKSISHRAALFSSFREGVSRFTNYNSNLDCTATLECLNQLGIEYQLDGTILLINGKKISDWQPASGPLNAQNSGTTARLISAVLSALPYKTELDGDVSLRKRPMQRIIQPLLEMGAHISSNNGNLPLLFEPVLELRHIIYQLPIASAQVKSCVLLAGLFADGETTVVEKIPSRDHTERLLKLPVEKRNGLSYISSSPELELPDISMKIPGDFSSAAFFITAALLVPASTLVVKNVSLNPTRTGYLDVLNKMGARISVNLEQEWPEPIGTIHVKSSSLKPVEIDEEIIPNIIDEIPILAVAATQMEGQFVLKNAKELRFKESDRIKTIVNNLRNLSIEIQEFEDGFALTGPQKIKAGQVYTFGDHRIAMAFSIAALLTNQEIKIDNPQCAAVSFPGFFDILNKINIK